MRRFASGRPRPSTPESVQPALLTSDEAVALSGLSRRELDVLRLLAEGHPYRVIAEKLVISDETVRSHVKRILRKTGQPNRTAAVTAALRAGIIQLSDNAALLPPGQSAQPAFTLPGDAAQVRFTPAEDGSRATFTLMGARATEPMPLRSPVPPAKGRAPRGH
jgi:DNA-binding CsgD family transcriptional regulator